MNLFENFGEWLYRKRMIHPGPLLESLSYAGDVINPKFVVVGEYVFLDSEYGNSRNNNLSVYRNYEKTYPEKSTVEAVENHIHLFDGVKKCYREDVKKISIAIAENLLKCLKYEFPDRKFVVFLELNYKDSVIVRFHQIREEEGLYIDPQYYKEEYDSGLFMMFM